jgi:RND family efflux transporter MFP subunit
MENNALLGENMKQLIFPLILILALTACSAGATPTPLPTVALDTNSQSGSDPDVVTASAEIAPVRDAQLSFPAIGTVKTVDVKVGDKVSAGQTLVTFDTALLEARVREAEAGVSLAEVQLAYLKRVGTDQRNLDSAQADIEASQARLDSAKAALASQSALNAPFDGTIVSVEVERGETVTPGRVIVLLADFSHFQVKTTDLSERDVTRVKVGQPVNISIEALGDTFTGKVSEISLVSSTLGGDVVYAVTIEFDSQPAGLLWGMSADVEIQTK